jgi:glycosyltransferase involved in cell wall biosynthesis
MTLIVAQLGARMHYAVPRILHQRGMLLRFFTDAYGGRFPVRLVRYLPDMMVPAGLRNLLARNAPLPPEKVRAFQLFGARYAFKLRRAFTPSDRTKAYLWAGTRFNELVLHEGLHDADAVYGCNSACEMIFRHARGKGLLTVMDQSSVPRLVEERILNSERKSCSNWEDAFNDEFSEEYARRERNEWELSDLILCPSDFVRDSVISEGGSPEKCVVVPYGVELPEAVPEKAREGADGLNVLFVGRVSLPKGIRFLCEAMRSFAGKRVTCRMVGQICVDERRLREYAPPNVELVGRVPRSEVARHYRWADVFCLPSLCEGSATVIYEALAHGLPVITTPNSGSIVRDGIEGVIVPIRDAGAIASAMDRFLQDRKHLECMSGAALKRAAFGSLEAYGERFVAAIGKASKDI